MNRKRGITLFIAVVLTLCAIACCGYSCSKPTDKNFSGQTFTVTYDTMTENGTEIVTVQGGETISEPFMPTRDGYIFGGWYLDESLTVACSVATLSVTENITLYAKWIASTIKLETNFYEAGTVVGQEVTKSGKKYIRATATNNPGYTFVGWYKGSTKVDATTSFVYDFELTSTETTYTATWIKCPITLEKTIDEGGSVAGLSQTALGKSATITATPNSGYTFKGWYDNGTRLTTNQSYSFTVSSTAKTYTAKFIKTGTTEYTSEKYFTAVYKAEGGTGDGSVTVRGGTKLKEPPTPVKSGYVFGGWYTNLNYAEANKWNFNNVVTSNVNLYAKWFASTITFQANPSAGGTLNCTKITESNVEKYQAVATTETGYVFLGWYRGTSLISSTKTYKFNANSEYVVTAKFTKCTSHTPDANCICTKCGAEYHSSKVASSGFCRHDNYLYFGSYPQSRVTDETIISALNSAAGAKPTSENNQGWTAYGYYGGTGNYMWYID
ncbi:MAG: InlB B-repeat-containing protein, partial [Christensenellales bacterium]